jgi:hypothetical protein
MRKLLIIFAVVIAILVVLDRVAVVVADGQIADRAQTSQGLSKKPNVSIKGFPFLTQVVRGHYGQVDVTVHDFTQKGLTVDKLVVHAHGVSVPLSKVLSGSVTEVPVDRADAQVTLSFANLNAYLKSTLAGQTLTVSGQDGRVTLTGTLPFPPRLSLSAAAAVHVSGSAITFRPASVDAIVARIPGGQGLRGLVENFFTVRLPVTQLPFGIQLRKATVTRDAVVIDASASGLTLRNPKS